MITKVVQLINRIGRSKLRTLSTCATLSKHTFLQQKETMQILNEEKKITSRILYVWLRDHCRCSACYNKETNQRQLDLLAALDNCQPEDIEIVEDNLRIVWAKDSHESVYNMNWLIKQMPKTRQTNAQKKHLWNAENLKTLRMPSVEFAEFNTTYGLRKHLKHLLKYGVSTVVGAPPTFEATQEISQRTSLVEETIYGKFWQFSNERMDHADTAFTNLALPAHTDSTYYHHTAGYQVFHCLEHAEGEGGETLLVDGFNVLQELKQENREAFDFLCKTPVPHHFLDKTVHLHVERPVIEIDSLTGEMTQLRFNPCDRAPLSNLPDADTVARFYQHYLSLTKIITRKDNEFWFKLTPGTVLFVDNFRVLHGRGAFTGKRLLAGCYLTRDDLFSKARVLGLL